VPDCHHKSAVRYLFSNFLSPTADPKPDLKAPLEIYVEFALKGTMYLNAEAQCSIFGAKILTSGGHNPPAF
jgi:hypothetical protein